MINLTYRIDDIGSSTKHFNQHGRKWVKFFGYRVFYFPFANIGFLKRLSLFKGWAIYDELTASEWSKILEIFDKNKIIPIVAVTACWVNKDSTLTPFPEKFPEEAEILRKAYLNNKVIIANHGLTHCVVGQHLPKFWNSNRKFHREFLPSLDQKLHTDHITRSQEILEGFFEKPVEIFVPPGNLWSLKTYYALKGTNIKKIMCKSYMHDSNEQINDIIHVGDSKNTIVFHDRELKLYGLGWLKDLIIKNKML